MEVTVYGPLRGATGEKTVTVDFDGGTVGEALSALVDAYPRAERHLFENETLQSGVRVAVDGESVDADDDCPADASLSVHPAMRGG
ncbi:ubiquitin-like small modifier protein 1 [Salinibaculum salinum]|uniref:ubiquitin-like small modifier protein 1 n=1 Tax=Salinibaculum salinum TaxID=3131996 RepID=UPI0030EE5F4C